MMKLSLEEALDWMQEVESGDTPDAPRPEYNGKVHGTRAVPFTFGQLYAGQKLTREHYQELGRVRARQRARERAGQV